jgi:RimJ/RimL family protein N-acetyltransferase
MIEIPEAGPRWADEVLARREVLPRKPDVGEVRTERLVIRPYVPADAPELFAISNGEPVTRMGRSVEAYDAERLVWRFMPWGPFATPADLQAGHDHFAGQADTRTLTIVDTATGELVGSVTLLANRPLDLSVEIGAVWYTPAVQGLGVNREVTLGLAEILFDLGYQRFEWKCDSLNLRSRHAAEAMGFTYEGTFRAHKVVKGRRRDTAWFSLLPTDR